MNKSLRRRGIAIASAVAMSVTGVTVASTAIAPAAWALEALNGEASNHIIDQGVGVHSNSKQVRGTAFIDRSGSSAVFNSNLSDEPLKGLNVYMQWKDDTGFVSPIYRTQTTEKGEFFFDLSENLKDATGAEHEFDLEINDSVMVRIWSDDPSGNKAVLPAAYQDDENPQFVSVIVGDRAANGTFFGYNRYNTGAWNTVVDVIEGKAIVFSDAPNPEGWLAKPVGEWSRGTDADGNPTPDGRFTDMGDYGAIKDSKLWWDQWQAGGVGPVAQIYYNLDENHGDQLADGVLVVASYLNDEVSKILDQWKAQNRGYTATQFKDYQRTVIEAYNTEHGEGAAIAETVVAPMSVTGVTAGRPEYYIPFKGTYGKSRDQMNGTAKLFDPAKFGQVADSYWIEGRDHVAGNTANDRSGVWSGANPQGDIRHINEEYMYIYPVQADGSPLAPTFDVSLNSMRNAMFTDPGEWDGAAIYFKKTAQYAYQKWDMQVLTANPKHDITNFDVTNYPATVGNTAKASTSGLVPRAAYTIRWVNEAGKVLKTEKVTADDAGTLAEVNYQVKPEDFAATDGSMKPSQLIRTEVIPGSVTDPTATDVMLSDSFIAYLVEYAPQTADVDTAKESDPDFNGPVDGNGSPVDGSSFALATVDDKGAATPADQAALRTAGVIGANDTVTIDPTSGKVTFTPAKVGPKTVRIPVLMTVPITMADGTTGTGQVLTYAEFTVDRQENTQADQVDPTAPGTADADGNVYSDPEKSKIENRPTVALPETLPEGVTIDSIKVEGLPAGLTASADGRTASGTLTEDVPAEGKVYPVKVTVTYGDGTTD
ncbi:MAG: hypothetical protein SPI77_04045, partial [Corynebacterium sp.]|nr:hypothetical protein [Corynebacterium sp.]